MRDLYTQTFGASMDDEDLDESEVAKRRLVQFLEAAGLYTRCAFPETASNYKGRGRDAYFVLPAEIRIELLCPTCTNRRTFEYKSANGTRRVEAGETVEIDFVCTHCRTAGAAFLVHASCEQGENHISLHKAGQWPSDRPRPDATLARALGAEVADFYSKGMLCERFGLGVAAHAYYRRVAEDVIDRLMAALRRFAAGIGNAELIGAIDRTAEDTQASNRIKAVKDLLPPMLRPEGAENPLGTIYAAVSEHLHARTDEECLAIAGNLRVALEFLLRTLEMTEIEKGTFENAIKKLQGTTAKKEKR
jgi:hypothetical protein